MTNEIINSEMMNEEQLNAVVGGTRGELENHMSAVANEIATTVQKAGIFLPFYPFTP